MTRIIRFSITKLFDSVEHDIKFTDDSPVTILSGPNGVGKTHILRIISYILRGAFLHIYGMPFETARIEFSDLRSLEVRKFNERDKGIGIRVEGFDLHGDSVGTHEVFLERFAEVPPWYERISPDRYRDTRNGRTFSADMVRRRYASQRQGFDMDESLASWLSEILDKQNAIMIDTKRLDNRPRKTSGESPSNSRIDEYIEQVKLQVAAARQESLAVSQAADQDFASRVLDRTANHVAIAELKRNYAEIAEQNAELYRSGLSEKLVNVQFPSDNVDGTEARVLSLFINDWERKLAPLLPVSDKLKSLQRIINEKFVRKTLRLDKSGSLVFLSDDGDGTNLRIPVSVLSSGEQHILALFTMLLFSAAPGSVVLIDEPEISLHAAWKHAFLADISEVARLADLQVILATHSSGIVNGHWELVRELGGNV
jgi:ABC-type transport system involved in cytochrome c biogenesis ATPase subunit